MFLTAIALNLWKLTNNCIIYGTMLNVPLHPAVYVQYVVVCAPTAATSRTIIHSSWRILKCSAYRFTNFRNFQNIRISDVSHYCKICMHTVEGVIHFHRCACDLLHQCAENWRGVRVTYHYPQKVPILGGWCGWFGVSWHPDFLPLCQLTPWTFCHQDRSPQQWTICPLRCSGNEK